MNPRIGIIGAGISGMVAACYLAKEGYAVTIFEKHDIPGGRARRFSANGFTFDMGPSWYWMPDVYQRFFGDMNRRAENYYTVDRLDPSYTVYFEQEKINIPASVNDLMQLFEEWEPGSSVRFQEYLDDAAEKYRIGIMEFAGKPSLRWSEFLTADIFSLLRRLQPLRSMQQHVERYFSHPIIRKIIAFPVIFLGAMPDRIPAMYSLMNYADTMLGTWYPRGGMYEVVNAVYKVAQELGVRFRFNCDVEGIGVENDKASSICTPGVEEPMDLVIGAGDYYYMEQLLLPRHRQYSEAYWQQREMAPSCLLYFLGVDRRLPLNHHNLFFDAGFDEHASALYTEPKWPADPLFYVCAPSVTDATTAPPGCENLFLLAPVAAGLSGDDAELRRLYLNRMLERLERRTGVSIRDHIIYQRDYALREFTADYHAFRGNAYGLANTLKQTAIGKPRMRSDKVTNLFFCGQLTVPGPGLPPAFLSGKIAATEAAKYLNRNNFYPSNKITDANEYRLSF